MNALLEHPAVQGGIAPFVVALAVAALLGRTRYAWFAIVAGYATQMVLSDGFSFAPLNALHKILLVCLLAPLVGRRRRLAGDARAPGRVRARRRRRRGDGVGVPVGAVAARRRADVAAGLGLVAFAAAMVASMVALRDDGLRAGVAGLGLGLAAGIAAFISASIGFLLVRRVRGGVRRRAAARLGRYGAPESPPACSARCRSA